MLVTVLADYTGSQRVEIATINMYSVPAKDDVIECYISDNETVNLRVNKRVWSISTIRGVTSKEDRVDVSLYVHAMDGKSTKWLEALISSEQEA